MRFINNWIHFFHLPNHFFVLVEALSIRKSKNLLQEWWNHSYLLNLCIFSLLRLKLHGKAHFYRKISCAAPPQGTCIRDALMEKRRESSPAPVCIWTHNLSGFSTGVLQPLPNVKSFLKIVKRVKSSWVRNQLAVVLSETKMSHGTNFQTPSSPNPN